MLNLFNSIAPLLMLVLAYLVAVFLGESLNPFRRPREPVRRRRFRLFRGLFLAGLLATLVGSLVWFQSLGRDPALPDSSFAGWFAAYAVSWALFALWPALTYLRSPHAGRRGETSRHPAVTTMPVANTPRAANAVVVCTQIPPGKVESMPASPVSKSSFDTEPSLDMALDLGAIDALPPLDLEREALEAELEPTESSSTARQRTPELELDERS